MVQSISTNTFGVAKWVVSPDATQGTHTTIQGAINSASSGDTIWVRDGTYTENPVLIAGITICAAPGDATTPTVTIVGNTSFTGTGTVVLSDLRFQTNSNFCLSVTGSNASVMNLKRCNIQATNNTAVQFSSSNSSASVVLDFTNAAITTTGIAMFSHSSAGTMRVRYCSWGNAGASTTANTASAGTLQILYSQLTNPLTTSSTNAYMSQYSTYDTSAQNVTALTVGGSGTNTKFGCVHSSGTASAISISSTLSLTSSAISSSNTNTITGAGTLNYSNLSFTGTSSGINTTTLVVIPVKPFNINIQVFAASGTYTPSVSMQYCQVESWGGGGGGGGCATTGGTTVSAGAGGGAGEYRKAEFSAATIGASQTVTLGAAGAAGASGNNAGGTGGNTTFGALLTSNGGSGGAGGAAGTSINGLGGLGGTGGSGGSLSVPGAPGSNSNGYAATILGIGSGFSVGGQGASSLVGAGGRSPSNAAGVAALGFGSGGSGGCATLSSGPFAGGAGTTGYVVVTEYIL